MLTATIFQNGDHREESLLDCCNSLRLVSNSYSETFRNVMATCHMHIKSLLWPMLINT